MKKRREIDVAKPLIRWLAAQDWEVYQEVQPEAYGPIADIVAKRHRIIWAIEVKQSLTASVVEQARQWIGFANYISVATAPINGHWPKGRNVIMDFMEWKGIGHIISDPQSSCFAARESVAPKLHRQISPLLVNALCEARKTYAEAGNSNGKRWTPFQETADTVRRIIKAHPGFTLKEIVEACNGRHHYSSAATFRSCISRYISSGVIDGIAVDSSKRPYRYYPEEQAC